MRKIGVLLLFLIMVTGLSAQANNFRLGFQLSPTISSISSDDSGIQKDGSNIGLRLGAIGEFHVSENVILTSGLNLAFHQGGKFKHDIGGNFWVNSQLSDDLLNTGDKPLPDGVKLKYGLQFLEIPFSLKLRTNEKGYFRYFLEAPVLSFNILTQARGNISSRTVNVEKENIKKDVSAANVFWGFGVGTEYAISVNNSLVFGLYYKSSIIDFTDNDAYKAFPNPDQKPGDPNDDFFRQDEASKGSISSITLRIGILF